MKLVIEFESKEIREENIKRLEAACFKTSMNKYNTLFVDINFLSFNRGGFIEIVDKDNNQTFIRLEDVSDFEIQK